MIKESVLTIENKHEKIFGIYTKPNKHNALGITIVFLHGWAGYRIGPHRIYVDFARRLSELGFHCIRYDFRGKGFSSLSYKPTFITMLEDIDIVLDYVYRNNIPKKIILIGICSGAKLAINYVMKSEKHIDNIIELSTTMLYPENSIKIELARTHSVIQSYINKMINLQIWKKLIQGELRWKLIFKIIFNPIVKTIKLIITKRIVKKPIKKNLEINKNYFINFKGEILAIHGEKDPETRISLKQVINLSKKYAIPLESHIVKGANHSFYSIKWKNEIFQIIQNWLIKKYPEISRNIKIPYNEARSGSEEANAGKSS